MKPYRRTSGILGAIKEGVSNAKARLHLPGIGAGRSMAIVAGVILCGAVVLVTILFFGVLKSQPTNDDSLPPGDLSAIVSPTLHEEEIPTATVRALLEVARPTRMVIEKIGVDAPIITLGLDANSVPEVPNGPDLVAWYTFSSRPGRGSNAVFSGHVDWTVNGQPVTAVFWGLKDLEVGDVVSLFLEDGSELQYAVTANVAVEYDDPEALKVMDETPNDVVTLISCGGAWVPDSSMPLGGNYTHRVIVRAELVGGIPEQ